jgi:hypothetical protein
MNSSPAVPGRGNNLRASDSDRDHAAEILREAAAEGRLTMEELDERLDAVYAAKTYAELEPITHDLPHPGTPSSPVPSPAPAGAVHRFGGEPTSSAAIGIMGGFSRKGNWVVPKDFTAVAIMGGGEIDLREARFAQPVVTIHAVTIMGGIEITVPDDANVQVTGMGIIGGFDHGASGGGQPGGPTIIINGIALMGGVDIRRKPLKKSKHQRLKSGKAREVE